MNQFYSEVMIGGGGVRVLGLLGRDGQFERGPQVI